MKRIAIRITILVLAIGASCLLVLATYSGCNKEETSKPLNPTGTAGVVDLDRVGKAMGWNEEMQKNLQTTRSQISEQLEGLLAPARDAVARKRAEIAKASNLTPSQIETMNAARQRSELEKLGLTAKQIDELVQVLAVLANEVAGAQQRLNQIMQAQQEAIVNAYRQAAQPSVRRVAIANNRSMVVTPGPNLLYSDSAIDLTDKVVDDLQHAMLGKVGLPPIPHIEVRSSGLPTTQSN